MGETSKKKLQEELNEALKGNKHAQETAKTVIESLFSKKNGSGKSNQLYDLSKFSYSNSKDSKAFRHISKNLNHKERSSLRKIMMEAEKSNQQRMEKWQKNNAKKSKKLSSQRKNIREQQMQLEDFLNKANVNMPVNEAEQLKKVTQETYKKLKASVKSYKKAEKRLESSLRHQKSKAIESGVANEFSSQTLKECYQEIDKQDNNSRNIHKNFMTDLDHTLEYADKQKAVLKKATEIPPPPLPERETPSHLKKAMKSRHNWFEKKYKDLDVDQIKQKVFDERKNGDLFDDEIKYVVDEKGLDKGEVEKVIQSAADEAAKVTLTERGANIRARSESRADLFTSMPDPQDWANKEKAAGQQKTTEKQKVSALTDKFEALSKKSVEQTANPKTERRGPQTISEKIKAKQKQIQAQTKKQSQHADSEHKPDSPKPT